MDTQKIAEIKLECIKIAAQYSSGSDAILVNAKKLWEAILGDHK